MNRASIESSKFLRLGYRNRSKFILTISIGIIIYGIISLFTSVPLSVNAIFMITAFVVMMAGQLLIGYKFGIVYPLYFVSCFLTVYFALFLWTIRNTNFLIIYPIVIVLYLVIIFVAHFKTKKNTGSLNWSSTISLLLFGLLIALGNGNLTIFATDAFFWISIVLFSLVSLPLLNSAYRSSILNKDLKIGNVEDFIEETRNKLLLKFNSEEVDMLLYYFEYSLNDFIEGQYETSFINSYKIAFDNEGKAFESIHSLPKNDQSARFSEIRAKLTHAKGRDANLAEIKKTRKELYKNSLDLIKIIKIQFIDATIQISTKNTHSRD